MSQPSGGSIVSGSPPTVTYDATYDIYYLNLYYDEKTTDGKVIIQHLDKNNNSLDGIAGLHDREQSLKEHQSYSFSHSIPDSGSGYTYSGYRKSLSGVPPSSGAITAGEYDLGTYTSASFPNPVYLNYYYDVDPTETAGEINIRHMVREGSTGTYSLAKQQTIPIAALPNSSSYSYDSSYGNFQGSNLSYVAYSNTVTTKTSQSVSLTSTLSKAYVTFFYEKPLSFTGDFDILPDTLPYKASFTLHPKNFQLKGCTYISHHFKIERNGSWTGDPVNGQTTDSTYTFGNYPWVIGVGIHSVSMQIVTSCGTSDWIGPKPLTVTGPTVNNPPTFQIGFVNPSQPKIPLHQVVEGTVLDLIYINDPTVPTPNDPDGDDLYFMGFDYSAGSAFVQSIPSKSIEYVNGQHNLTMDSLGFQNICGQMRDEFGATATACTYIEVVPKNPVPVIDCPPSVIANHPISSGAIGSARSYSPISYLKIDHSRDEWTNKQSSYPNPGTTDITVQVSLSVYDENGLKSLAPATCTIIVKPDLPPVAKLVVPPLSVRGTLLDLLNKSTSPDADAIVTAEYRYKYDANNNGFADDAWKSAAGTLTKLQFTPTKVGNYLFYLKVTEEYGQWDDTNSDSPSALTLNVVNNAPEVSFDLEGNNPQPDLDPYTRIQAEEMINWPIYVPGTNNLVYNNTNLWRTSAGSLISGEGRNFGQQYDEAYTYNVMRFSRTLESYQAYPLTNNGFGSNELNPWRSTLQSNVVANVLNKKGDGLLTWYYNPPKIRSTKKLLFYDYHNTTSSYNSTTGHTTYYYDDEFIALDPQKLSPVKDVIGDWGSVSQAYTKGDPNAYVVTNSSFGPRSVDFLYEGTMKKNIQVIVTSLPDYELADHYLYIKRYWSYGNGQNLSDIGVFDARTGQELSSTFANPTIDLGQQNTNIWNMDFCGVQGTSVILCNTVSNGNERHYKLTRDMALIELPTWTAPAPVNPNIKTMDNPQYTSLASMTDAAGNTYRYEAYYNQTYNSGYYDLNVAKYNADYTLAWRQYIGDSIRNDAAVQGQQISTTPQNSFMSAYAYPEIKSGFYFNPAKNELYARVYYDHTRPGDVLPLMYERVYVLHTGTGAIKRKADSLNGDDMGMYHYGGSDFGAYTQFSTDFSGNLAPKSRLSQTADGYRTSLDRTNGATCDAGGGTMYSTYGHSKIFDAAGNTAGSVLTGCNYSPSPIYGAYYMDGVYVSLSQGRPTTSSDSGTYSNTMSLTVSVGPPTTNPLIVKPFTSGQFYSPFSLSDAEAKFNFKLDDADYDNEWLGYSFRMKDRQNGYALETDAKKIELVKYVAGARTVIATQDYPLLSQKTYAVKLRASGSHLAVFLDNTPIFEADDGTYASGRFGYFSNKAFVTFSGLAYKPMTSNDAWSDQYAIWDAGSATAEVKYDNIVFSDPENDPPAGGVYDWTVQHTARFIHNQGVSALNGKTFHDAQLKFDKVGDYVVSLKAKDDPHPDYLAPDNTFDEYRKDSNTFTKKITVHRRPIAKFALASDAAHKLQWTDYSYDPDRYFSGTDYSTEATGIDYKATKGILQKRFYYVTPSGAYKEAKLTAPQEVGTYEIGLAVKDEYGAWSDWYVTMLPVTDLAPPNNPPVPGFTSNRVNTFRGVPVTFDSTAHDIEDGDRTKLPHEYYISNETAGGTETFASDSRTNWTKSFSSVGTFDVRQVVSDSDGATAEFGLQVNILNQKPTAAITVPESTDQANPTKTIVLRPDFNWNYWDADGDNQTQFQMKIYKYGGVLLHDSGIKTSGAVDWVPGADLPEHVNMYVVVRVFDGYDWSDYSDPHYFYIETNRPPTADFDWSPKPVYEGDIVKIAQTIDDPDKDPLSVQYVVKDPNGVETAFTYTLNSPYAPSGPSFKGTRVGAYSVRLTVSDGKAPPVATTKNVIVLPLAVNGQVKHTDLWNERRIESNLKSSGDPEQPRGYNVFWAGERFLLRAATTDTVTTTDAVEVTATMNGKTATLTPTDASRTSWSGEMWEETFEKLPDGPLTFGFKATYSNGTVKTATVTVVISGNVQQTVGVHRRD
ncbi:hypothetical protein [Paenibacillus glycinis]|uniref:Uncharacterized protein n=1 Tax=Paenibacillus glycinis TaxID=2697035 RepID=A0ABW9XVQ1_9BACL|nr:hypothetical protein [Paenibacillus glycinis]NBD26523.1 hypothetical protein [Paenibacillus glycinis]